MSTEHEAKTYPIQAYVFATVLAALVFMLVAALNDYGTAAFAAPLIVGWAWVSLWLFGKIDSSEDAPQAH
ncbi:MAG: hypothetical protein Q8L05_05970 [Actinomycetota bacterium]|nr:hypothetical protein [Actinomycetota bacterium]MDP2289205.1 hypothetical protein [Actinomycetota bacterium]